MRRSFYLGASCVVVVLTLAACDSSSKLPASRVAASCDDEPEVPTTTDEPPPPSVFLDGAPAEARPIEATMDVGGRTVHMRPLHDELQLTYVHNLVGSAELDLLVELATARGRPSSPRAPSRARGAGTT